MNLFIILILATITHNAHAFIGSPAPPGSPTFTTSHFSGSQNCSICHNGLVDNTGADVSIITDWSSTMMANASRDPFWRAKVRSQLARSPNLQTVINDKCTKCHAPMANTQAKKDGTLATQTIFDGGILSAGHAKHNAAMDGVSCTLCHQIPNSFALGTLGGMSGNYTINDSRIVYGPFAAAGEPSLLVTQMANFSGYTPFYSPHIKESKLCASCHNLKTPYTDDAGNILSTTPESEFPEQTPYIEWEQSSYATQKSCQGCHMSRANGVKISAFYQPPLRDNFAIHDLVGANKLMLDIFNNNKTQLGVLSNNFAETISKTDVMLKSAATMSVIEQRGDTANMLDFTLKINSLTGHKLPTGYPSRRVILHVTVSNSQNQVVFESGKVNADGSVVGVDADVQNTLFEPHYDLITSADQVQVYEAIMGNNLGNVTYTLLRGKEYLKDNRILPLGFNKTTATSDVHVVGEAVNDANFIGGSDQIKYRLNLPTGNYTIKAELVYQTLSRAFANDLFSDTVTPEVVDFKTMFDNSPQKSSVIASLAFAGTVDTNGNGKSDIVWRNSSTGENHLYQMNGASYTDTVIDTVDPAWQIKGKGDYNGDGKTDILWRNTVTGINYIYQMNGAVPTAVYLDTVSDLAWKIVGSGDFNADGKVDILWRNSDTGINYLYLMNATGYNAAYVNTVADQKWQIKGTGDYNGDRKADILWRNSDTGADYLFLMDGANVSGIKGIYTVADLNWDIKGSGDFNADGTIDILWRNSSTGDNYLFLMNNGDVSSINYIDTKADQAWQVQGTSDYNGDDRSDIFWRNAITGVNEVYFMNGAAAILANVSTVSGVWKIAYIP